MSFSSGWAVSHHSRQWLPDHMTLTVCSAEMRQNHHTTQFLHNAETKPNSVIARLQQNKVVFKITFYSDAPIPIADPGIF